MTQTDPDGLDRRALLRAGFGLAAAGAVAGASACASTPQAAGSSGTGAEASSAKESNAAGQAASASDRPPLPDGPELLGPIASSELEERVRRARRLLRAEQAEAYIAVASTDLFYFTGASWRVSERLFAWVLPAEADPFFIVPAFEARRAEERIGQETMAKTYLWQEHEDPFRLLVSKLPRRAAPGPRRVLLDPRAPFGFAARIGGVDLEPTSAEALSSTLRQVKSPAELDRMRVANVITQRAIRWAFSQLREGMTGSEIAGLVVEASRAQGGERPWVLALVGAAAAFPHGTKTEPPLAQGDVVLVDAGCSVAGYWSDLTRTVFFGSPSAEAEKAWWATRAAQDAAMTMVKPGALPHDVDSAARQTLGKNGYGDEYQLLTHRLGHGIGLDVHEAPYMVRDNHEPLVANNTFSNEPGIYIPGRFGIRQEDIVVVTEEGASYLSERQGGPSAADV